MASALKSSFIFGAVLVLSLLCVREMGVRFNVTKSYPRGFYLQTHQPLARGSLVIFCPTDSPLFREALRRGYLGAGFCPGGYGYMIKKIVAAGSDDVTINSLGVTVNGAIIANSKPMTADIEGRKLINFSLSGAALQNDQLLLMSDYSPKSFDGRYFGPVNRDKIISTVQPLLVW